MQRDLNLAVIIRPFTGNQDIKQPVAFLLNIMAPPPNPPTIATP